MPTATRITATATPAARARAVKSGSSRPLAGSEPRRGSIAAHDLPDEPGDLDRGAVVKIRGDDLHADGETAGRVSNGYDG